MQTTYYGYLETPQDVSSDGNNIQCLNGQITFNTIAAETILNKAQSDQTDIIVHVIIMKFILRLYALLYSTYTVFKLYISTIHFKCRTNGFIALN